MADLYFIPLNYASKQLQNDKEVVLTAVKKNGLALDYASNALKDTKVVLAAVKQNGFALSYASLKLKADKDLILAAFKKNKNVFNLNFVMKALQNDQQLLDELRRLNFITNKQINKLKKTIIIII